jgi:fibronectin-binding autotransporter adhesin
MKTPSTRRFLLRWNLLAAAVVLAPALHAANFTWDGGPAGTGTSFLTAENWTPETVPGTGDVAVWNNLVGGNLALTFGGAVGGANGLDLVLHSAQTANVSLTSTIGTTFRANNITIAAGAGALGIGQSGTVFTMALGSGSVTSRTWTNNSSNTATLGTSVQIANGGAVAQALTVTGSGNWLVAGSIGNAISGGNAISITKTGSGTLTLSGNNVNSSSNAWTGAATVSAGTMIVSGNSGSATFAANGGVLDATGTLGVTNIQSGGALEVGSGVIENTATGALSFLGTGEFRFDLNTSTVTADLVNVTGNLIIANTAILTLGDLGSDEVLTMGTTFSIIDYSGAWDGGAFAGYSDDSVFNFGVNQFRISYNGLDNLSSEVVLTVVPEPGVSILLAAAGCGILIFRRRRAA